MEKLESLTDWNQLLSNDDRTYVEDNLVVNIFGELEDSYMVVERYISNSPRTVHQFVFHSKNHTNPLFGLFAFLSKYNFSLKQLMQKIDESDFEEDDFNEVLILDSIEIVRYELIEN